MRKSLFIGALLPFMCAAAHADPVTPTVTSSAGTSYNTTQLTDFATSSADMIGSLVTVTFLGGTSNSAVWAANGASAAGWSLSVSGDTFNTPWTFTNTANNATRANVATITGLSFDGVPGNTTFDIVSTPTDSPGSSSGKAITSVTGPAGLTVGALYTNRLLVGGTFYGDEYTKLVLSFGGTGGGLTAGNVLTYVADTDNAMARSGITPSVPEPATWAMMLIGFGMVGVGVRRRVRQSDVKFNAKIGRIAAGEGIA